VKPRPGFDPASLVAGVIVIALGGMLLLDQVDVLALSFDYLAPLVFAAIGGILLACGLAGPPRGRS
jgi:cell wall-active antibiotic response 4TMS protein YvqF